MDVEKTAEYIVNLRYSTILENGKIYLSFNGENKTGSWEVPGTGAFSAYSNTETKVNLVAGEQVMRCN